MIFSRYFWIFFGFFLLLGVGCTNKSGEVRNPAPAADSGTGSYTEIPVTDADESEASAELSWRFDWEKWQGSGNVPDCSDPIQIPAPVALDNVTHILYPGQARGGDYKPHGGFRFDNAASNDVEVRAVMSAHVFRGSRYMEVGEVQYMFEFINDCGIMYRFDHLLTLTSKFADIAAVLPEVVEGDSRTQLITPSITVDEGETIATEVGFRGSKGAPNVFFDFGLYDLRGKNSAATDPAWSAEHAQELDPYGLCWLDNFSSPDAQLIKALPAGDSRSGSKSDYCQENL